MGVYGHLSFDVVSAAKVVRLNLLIRGDLEALQRH